jgi:tetratricopeptide (TPR) repeat protein
LILPPLPSRPRALGLLLLLLTALLPAGARAEPEQLREARARFDAGKYEESLPLVEALLDEKLLAAEADLVEAWRIRGLSHLYRGRGEEAQTALFALLQIDPDFALDPLLAPPVAIEALEAVRSANAEQLEHIRQGRRRQRQLEEETRRNLEEAARKRREQESGLQRVVRVERHSFLTNLIPFGAAQLEQGRTQTGAVLAIGQGLGIAGTVLTYSQVHSYIESDGRVKAQNLKAAQGWRAANWIVFGATAALYLGGVVEAVLNYEPETVTEFLAPRQPGEPPAPPPPQGAAAPYVAPVEGGAAAGLAGSF